ncbi:hypothetical protein BC826DRAFT_734384 [Russula brevipes]|nr:hypothetical protein BC826DRAFT_734384 [Russula brevipes]
MELGAREREHEQLCPMIRLHLVGHLYREEKVRHEHEVVHRDPNRAPRLAVGHAHARFDKGLEICPQLCCVFQAATPRRRRARFGDQSQDFSAIRLQRGVSCNFYADKLFTRIVSWGHRKASGELPTASFSCKGGILGRSKWSTEDDASRLNAPSSLSRGEGWEAEATSR